MPDDSRRDAHEFYPFGWCDGTAKVTILSLAYTNPDDLIWHGIQEAGRNEGREIGEEELNGTDD